MRFDSYRDEKMGELVVTARIGRQDMITEHLPKIVNQIQRQVASELAADCVNNYLPEIMEKISPAAIANMAIAEAGATVNETLHKKMPDKIQIIEKTSRPEVFQRGFLGGLRKL